MTRALWTEIGIQDAGSDDENARSAVLEPNVKILWKDFRKMAFNFRSTALFVMPRVQFLCVNPNHQNGARSRADLRRCGEILDKLQDIFPDQDTQGALVVPTVDFRAPVLNVHDRRFGIGVPAFRLSSVGDEHVYCISSVCA